MALDSKTLVVPKPSSRKQVAAGLALPSSYARMRLGMKLHAKQAVVLDDLFSKPRGKTRLAFVCGNEVGKGLPCNELLPTNQGWKRMGDIKVGDVLYTNEGAECRVTFATGIMYGKPCYRVEFSDGQSMVVSGDHLWSTIYCDANKHSRKKKCLADYKSEVVFNTEQIRATLRYTRGGGGSAHSIPVSKAIDSSPNALGFPPYLLGLWLGNGHSATTVLTCHRKDESHYKTACAMAECASKVTYDKRSLSTYVSFSLGKDGTRSIARRSLVDLGVLNNKHIPPQYLRGAALDRRQLFAGLMDSDGTTDNRGQCEITLTNHRLALDTWELCLSLGYKATMGEGVARIKGKSYGPKYRISFRTDNRHSPFKMARKHNCLPSPKGSERPADVRFITAVVPVPSVPVRCIQVDSQDHCYLAGRGFIKTHNTSRVAVAAILYALEIMNARVQMTSGSDRQLKEQLVPNLKRQSHKFPGWEFLDRSIKIGGINQFLAYAARDEGTFQGFHEESEDEALIPQLILVDESAAVRDEILAAAEDRCNPTWLLFMGSPLSPQGKFYSMTRDLAAFYSLHRLSKVDCLASRGGWLNDDDVARTIAKNCNLPLHIATEILARGEHLGQVKDPVTLSSVFAEFSQFVENALLTLTEYDKALDNPPPERGSDRHGFMDFAGGRAKNVFAVRRGNRVWIEKAWVEPNEMTAVGEFVQLLKKLEREIGLKPEEVDGDGDGLGGPMVRRIQELGYPINDFHGGMAARFEDQYGNAWSEAWGSTVSRLKECSLTIPRDDALRGQLLGRKIKRNSKGLFMLESKEEMAKRGVPSPDEADAVCCAAMPAMQLQSIPVMGGQSYVPKQTKDDFWNPRDNFSSGEDQELPGVHMG